MTDAPAKRRPSIMPLLVYGLGPGLSFLIGYLVAPVPEEAKIFIATAVFMATAVALTLAYAITRRKLWSQPWTTLLVVVMGGLTLWLHDETLIKIRPTLLYGGGAVLTAAALATRHPWLEARLTVKELVLDDVGQRRMRLLLIGFGTGMALLNELVWRNSSDLFWIGFQIWGPVVGFVPFLAAMVSTVNRHGTVQCKVQTAD